MLCGDLHVQHSCFFLGASAMRYRARRKCCNRRAQGLGSASSGCVNVKLALPCCAALPQQPLLPIAASARYSVSVHPSTPAPLPLLSPLCMPIAMMPCPHTTFARLLRHLGLRGEEVEFTADWLRQSLPGLEAALQDPQLLEGLASDESDSAVAADSAVVATCSRLVELHPPLASAVALLALKTPSTVGLAERLLDLGAPVDWADCSGEWWGCMPSCGWRSFRRGTLQLPPLRACCSPRLPPKTFPPLAPSTTDLATTKLPAAQDAAAGSLLPQQSRPHPLGPAADRGRLPGGRTGGR